MPGMNIYGELYRAQLERLSSNPSTGVGSRIFWHTVEIRAKYDDGSLIRAFLANDQQCVLGNHATAANNVRLNRGASGVIQAVLASDSTAEGSLSTSLAQWDARIANYAASSLPSAVAGSVGQLSYVTDEALPAFNTGSAWKRLVSTDATQTLTNKTLTTPTMSTPTVEHVATPSNPSAGYSKLYFKSDNNLYALTSGGTETRFITNSSNVWATDAYDNSDNGTSIPNTVDAVTVDTSTAFAMTLPDCASNPGKVFRIKKISSDFNAFTLNRAGSDTIQGAAAAGNSTTLNTQGEEIEIVSFGSTVWQIINRRVPSNSVSVTMTNGLTGGTGNTTTAFMQRRGDRAVFEGIIKWTTVFTGGTATLTLPTGLTIDTNKLPDWASFSASWGSFGIVQMRDLSGGDHYLGNVNYSSTTAVILQRYRHDTPGGSNAISGINSITTTTPHTWGNSDRLYFRFEVPISGWNG